MIAYLKHIWWRIAYIRAEKKHWKEGKYRG